MKKLILFIAMAFLQACVSHTAVKEGVNTINGLQLETFGAWSQKQGDGVTTWTRDGYALNEISVTLLKDKDPILRGLKKTEEGFLVRADHGVDTIMEMLTDAISISGGLNARLIDPVTLSIGGNDAAKFSIIYDTSYGLTYQSLNLIVKSNNGFHLVRCSAPKEHYYKTLQTEFDQIIDSVMVL